jgi:hypothetical protein
MNRFVYDAILLAQRGRLDSLSSGFRGRRARFDTQDIVTVLLIAAGIAVAVWVLSYFLRLQERRRGYASPLGLFLSLCRAHRLRWSQWWLLWRVAGAQQLRDPARLFLEPERLDPANLDRLFETRQAKLKQIRDRLFDQLEEQEEYRDWEWPNLDRLPEGALLSPMSADPTLETTPPGATPDPNVGAAATGSS